MVTAFGDPAGATDDVILDTNGQSGECSRLVCNPVDKYAVTAVKIWIQTGRCFLSYSGKRVGQDIPAYAGLKHVYPADQCPVGLLLVSTLYSKQF